MRQCPDRYTFRAGQNLPDKEFRYLRTVIVTAAVYRGFNSMLSHLLLTFRHALESSSCLPVSVCGTGSIFYSHSFSRLLPSLLPAHSQSLTTEATNARLNPSKVSLCLNGWRLRNFYRMCIGYAFRPRLSSRLTRSGRTFLLKP